MRSREKKIARAWLTSPTTGVIELAHDWRARHKPPLSLCRGGGAEVSHWATLTRLPDYTFGCESAYFVNKKEEMFFFLPMSRLPADTDFLTTAVYLAGDFNGWQQAAGQREWRLQPAKLAGDTVLMLALRADKFFSQPPMRFKFINGDHGWLDVPLDAPNLIRDDQGNTNYFIDPERTGQHRFHFTMAAPLDLAEPWAVRWSEGEDGQSVPLRPGEFFHRLKTHLPLGAQAGGDETIFRLFAPRAKSVELCVCDNLEAQDTAHRYALARHAQAPGVWELTLAQNLHGWFYWYHVDGPQNEFGAFNQTQRILDPYALAAVDRIGPGIVLDREWVGRGDRDFPTPAWQDLIIAEAHVRDLTAHAPVKASPAERQGFAGLAKWVQSPEFYLHKLGVNAVELQPVHEFDNKTPEEYHWGYMTNNFFAPESSYSLDPARASGVRELQELVRSFHRRGIAVLIDVVFNHVGEPAHLMFIDKLYYFEQDDAGKLSNWSGCGNDLHARSAMATRLIIDSCTHAIEAYGVDGFRFDLADLIGLEVLREVEAALKKVKPGVVLISEPWSFRGHIAGALRDTGWASWNDGYRNFLREFVRGGSTRGGFEYFLKGSPWHFAKWPAQTVNYTESHDDRTWIDMITENANFDGFSPTANDRRRTHLMAAILLASVGIPMISAGQDFLRSKHGVNNTYQQGDLNALDYRRLYRFPSTHAYFADWIAFRRSEHGRLLRLFSRPGETFFQFFFAADSTAAAVLYNADRSHGPL
ncbi:MAG TPA: alpha-amylase family glycosyl hydrolase, partial [Opitutaceae bacterium]|nr:alpha-amylase family glycosyl hydrolase [Opitutaceae bacterium]